MTAERPTGGNGTGGNGTGPSTSDTTPATLPGPRAGAAGPGVQAARVARVAAGRADPACSGWGWACRPRSRRTSMGPFDACSGISGRRRRASSLVILLAVVSVFFAVIGPKIMSNAINLIFEGAISKTLPAGVTQEQVIAGARAAGQDQFANMAASMHLTPGVGIDFGALASILLTLVLVYVISAIFSWAQSYIMAGVTQRSVLRLRTEVDEKLGRLPLRYFDGHPRGDLLSRVTNDIDNIGQSLQQSLTQMITSLLTIVGVLIMMLLISPTLALVSLPSCPCRCSRPSSSSAARRSSSSPSGRRPAASTATSRRCTAGTRS